MSVGQRLLASPWRRARWLVLAPHADDETLGTGALIAEAAADDRLAGVVFLTDGCGSHPADVPGGPARLARRRRTEARNALRHLTACRPVAPVFMDWPDAHPFPAGDPRFRASRDRLASMLRQRRVDAVAVTAAHEPHCDHAAFRHLAAAAIAIARRPIDLFEYVVWADAPSGPALRTRSMPVGQRRRALQCHRSQLSALLGDGFRLPREGTRMAGYDRLYPVRTRHAA